MIGGSLLLFALRAPALMAAASSRSSRGEGALVLNNILLCSIAAVVITGTMYPLFSDLLFGAKLSVGAPFFNATVLPLSVPVFLAMAGRAGAAVEARRLPPGAAAALVGGADCGPGRRAAGDAVAAAAGPAFACAIWIVTASAAEIVERIRLFRIPLGDSLARLRGLPLSVLGAALAHAGMGVTVAGIAGMAFATQSVVLLRPGEHTQAAGMTWTLESLTDGAGSNYSARIANLRVSRPGASDLLMHPSRRTFPVQQITTTEAAIRTTGFADIYAVMGEERDGAAVLRLNYNPLAPWIWLGGLVMAIGGGLSLVDRRLRVGAPARRAVAVPA
ncbi:MAG: cytochrome c-type biogenesis CcmF C-terminal domain-containing protein [Acetobacteraceae bacterium]